MLKCQCQKLLINRKCQKRLMFLQGVTVYENFFKVQNFESCLQHDKKKFFIDNHYKTIFRSVRMVSSSYTMLY